MIMTQRPWLILLLVVPLAMQHALAQDPIADCTRSVGGPGKAAFLLFDRELRAALATPDAASLALLVAFPLRVNSSDEATISVDNPAALQVRFQEVFPSGVRKAVLNQKVGEVFCKYTGIMYGSGEVWVQVVGQGNAERYALTAVNLPGAGKIASPKSWPLKTPRVEFACNAEQHRLIIDTNATGAMRFREWNQPHSISDKPDMEVPSGTKELEGTDPCTHAIWTFQQGKTEFVLSELGCTENEVPQGAKGTLEVSIDGTQQISSWCY